MTHIQRYIFFNVLRAVLTIVGGLTLIAILAQGISQTELIVENHQSALTYLRVVALGAPQVIAVLGPIALFVAALNALNRVQRDNEVVVAQAAGMTRWQVASPVLRLAVLVAIVHLCVNLFIQPLAQRELRETIADARADIATSLIRPGSFTYPTDSLTIYVRESAGGTFRDMLISDTRDRERPVDYIAQRGNLIEIEGTPAIRMSIGQIQQLDDLGQLSILDFDDYVFDLSDFLAEDSDLALKPSDRFLHELFYPDLGDWRQNLDKGKYLAEAHTRLSLPLLNITMAFIAILAVVGGNFSRRGYQKRIIIASVGAIFLIILTLTIQPSAAKDPELSILQYALPLGTAAVIAMIYLLGGIRFPFGRKRKHQKSIETSAEAA